MALATVSSTPARQRKRLRFRIIVSVLLIGTLLSVLFAGYAVLLRGYLEDRLIGSTLSREITNYADAFQRDPDNFFIEFSKIRGFVYGKAKFGNVPLAWRELPDGVHRLTEETSEGRVAYKLAVLKQSEHWFFLRYDTTAEERTRRSVAIAIGLSVVLFSGLALLLGIYSSNRIMSPVLDLVRRVQKLGRHGAKPETLASHFARDEVGTLASALDDYSSRLTRLVERDREFNNDVSHELRTPLAVIRSTSELILGMSDLPPKVIERMQRIERSVKQSTELIEALLHLSRGEKQAPTDGDFTKVEKVLPFVIEAHRPQLNRKPVEVEIMVKKSAFVAAPESVLSVALGNLIGNAFKYTPKGKVVIEVESDAVHVIDSGPGLSEADQQNAFQRHYRGTHVQQTGGAGLGLAIVKRLCDLYGWRVELAPADTGGLKASLRFGSESEPYTDTQ
jgi:signal transduction histidine kinase